MSLTPTNDRQITPDSTASSASSPTPSNERLQLAGGNGAIEQVAGEVFGGLINRAANRASQAPAPQPTTAPTSNAHPRESLQDAAADVFGQITGKSAPQPSAPRQSADDALSGLSTPTSPALPGRGTAPAPATPVAQNGGRQYHPDLDDEDMAEINKARDRANSGTAPQRGNGQGLDPNNPLFAPALEVMGQIRSQILPQIYAAVEREWGPNAAQKPETVKLEAENERGEKVEVDYTTNTRSVRDLTTGENPEKVKRVLGSDEFQQYVESAGGTEVAGRRLSSFHRVYSGDAAVAIEKEMRVLVALKGGEWEEPTANKPVANVVAVRGLDFDRGLIGNDNKTYDDTMFVAIRNPNGQVDVHEYRMTTESSSEARGVGRLASEQVEYVRGLHKGRDPGYRLRGNAADGTREGMSGEYQIVGANIHSAYAGRDYDSSTPLAPGVSLGCQVVASSKSGFEKEMVGTLDNQGISDFQYTIVDPGELRLLRDTLAERGATSTLTSARRS